MDRAAEDELTLTASGQWTDYHISLNWRGDLETLHIACAFDAKIPENRLSEVYRLVAQINEQLWLGHFDVWLHEGLIMYRHGLMLNGAVATAGPQPSDDDVAYVSALTGDGLDGLRDRIATALRGRLVPVDAIVPYPRAELLARARSAGEVTERFTDDGVRITGRLPESLAGEIAAVAAQPTQRQRPRPARTA